MTRMEINGSETGVVRLFHVDLPPEAVDRFVTEAGTGEWPLRYALGADALRPDFVEVVAIRDLGDMPLSTYLAEAHGLSGRDFADARGQIDALRGHVLILPSRAFDHKSQTLTVAAPLRWIGSFAEPKTRGRGPALRSASARGVAGGTGAGPEAGRSRTLRWVLIVLAVLTVAILLIGLGAGS